MLGRKDDGEAAGVLTWKSNQIIEGKRAQHLILLSDGPRCRHRAVCVRHQGELEVTERKPEQHMSRFATNKGKSIAVPELAEFREVQFWFVLFLFLEFSVVSIARTGDSRTINNETLVLFLLCAYSVSHFHFLTFYMVSLKIKLKYNKWMNTFRELWWLSVLSSC